MNVDFLYSVQVGDVRLCVRFEAHYTSASQSFEHFGFRGSQTEVDLTSITFDRTEFDPAHSAEIQNMIDEGAIDNAAFDAIACAA